MEEIRVYLIRNAHALNCIYSVMSDEKFMDIAEERGTVFSLTGFQEQFNSAWIQLDSMTDQIRFITIKN